MKATPNTGETTQERTPSTQEQVAYFKANLPLKRLQVEMQELNTKFVEMKVREAEAVSKLQDIQREQHLMQAEQERIQKENIIEHTITQKDIEMNPEIEKAGIKVGQKIGIPKDLYPTLNLENKGSNTPEVDNNIKPGDDQSSMKVVKEEQVTAE